MEKFYPIHKKVFIFLFVLVFFNVVVLSQGIYILLKGDDLVIESLVLLTKKISCDRRSEAVMTIMADRIVWDFNSIMTRN